MAPKKKQSEQELKRLEQERKRQEEEQLRLEEQRKKYLPERLAQTELILPASAPLIIDFPSKTLQFISQKIRVGLKELLPNFLENQSPQRNKFIQKELHYYIKDSIEIFGAQKLPQNLIKHRIFIGIMLSVLINGVLQGSQWSEKKRNEDEKLIKELVTKHKNFLKKNDGIKILHYASEKYFGRFKVITMFDKFKKVQKQRLSKIYQETPSIYINTDETKWIDLTQKKQQSEEQKQSV